MSHAVRLASSRDVPSWLELVAEVEGLFGPMPGFEDHIRRGLQRGTALVVVDDGDRVLGAALVSADDRPHHIHWLAVRESVRREGVGATLVTAILERWPTGAVGVVTFSSEMAGGEAARGLYERFGFECQGRAELAPNGGRRDLFVLRP